MGYAKSAGLAGCLVLAAAGAQAADGNFTNITATGNATINGKVGIGVTPSANKFEVNETVGQFLTVKFKATNHSTLLDVDASGAGNEARFQFRNAGLGTWRLRAFNNDNSLRFFEDVNNFDSMTLKLGGNIGIGTTSPTEKLDVIGNIRAEDDVSCAVLEIRGAGNDLAETFKVSSPATEIQPGMVVAIDAANPGALVLASEPYDRKVAGIISGAGDLHAGIHLGDTPKDGEQAVALTGRVWCWVDASFGAVVPGDSLTSSLTPGHAMKVTDHANAQGASLGKAMSSLEAGKGLVLVLVNLH